MRRIIVLGTLGVYWIALFVGTHTPNGVGGLGKVSDKLLHFGAYAGLAFLLAWALTTLGLRHGPLLLPLAIAALYGCIDELSQMAVPGRQAEVADWAADVFGAGVGVLAFGICSLVVRRFFTGSSGAKSQVITKSTA